MQRNLYEGSFQIQLANEWWGQGKESLDPKEEGKESCFTLKRGGSKSFRPKCYINLPLSPLLNTQKTDH